MGGHGLVPVAAPTVLVGDGWCVAAAGAGHPAWGAAPTGCHVGLLCLCARQVVVLLRRHHRSCRPAAAQGVSWSVLFCSDERCFNWWQAPQASSQVFDSAISARGCWHRLLWPVYPHRALASEVSGLGPCACLMEGPARASVLLAPRCHVGGGQGPCDPSIEFDD